MRGPISKFDHGWCMSPTKCKRNLNANRRRNPDPQPACANGICGENNPHRVIGKDNYFLSADGLLMLARNDQPPPDLKYFNREKR
jgi:hypothetical protein